MSLRIEKTHPEIGARVWGVDLSRPIDAEVAAAMRKAFDDNIMLVFPDQELGEQEQLRAAEVFGRVAWRKKPIVGDGPGGNFDTPFMLVTISLKTASPSGPLAMARCGSTTTRAITPSRIARRCFTP
jgi:alpha-ketoglutarate-dependent taurine dioxygenase